jgi:hypothetical protein
LKNIRVLLICSALVSKLISCTPSSSSAIILQEPELGLSLGTDKGIYHAGEAIRAKITISNVGNKNILVKNSLGLNSLGSPVTAWDIVFIFESKTSKQPDWTVKVDLGPLRRDDFVVLSPGASIEGECVLQEFYTIEEGEYLFFALYQNSVDPGDGKHAWRGVLSSNFVDFAIQP